MPFYLDPPTKELRFGDVVTGFQHPTIRIDNPVTELDLKINVKNPPCLVVMSPCCQIEQTSIALAPLVPVRDAIVLRHPRLHSNLTLINVPFPPKEGLTDEQIAKMDPAKQAEVLSGPAEYTWQDCFIYEPNGLFKEYAVKRGKTQPAVTLKYYMVDFKSIFRVDCALIEREKGANAASGAKAPPGVKVSELTVETRANLRDKLTFYFSRNADEGEV